MVKKRLINSLLVIAFFAIFICICICTDTNTYVDASSPTGTVFTPASSYGEELAAGDYYLDSDFDDVDLSQYVIKEGATVNINLNGHSLKPKYALTFKVYGTLNITNDKEDGVIEPYYNEYSTDPFITLYKNGNLSITNVKFVSGGNVFDYTNQQSAEDKAINNEVNITDCEFVGDLRLITNTPSYGINIDKRSLYIKNTKFNTEGEVVIKTCGDIVFDNCEIKHTNPKPGASGSSKGGFLYDSGIKYGTDGNLKAGSIKLKDCTVKDLDILFEFYQSETTVNFEFSGSTTFSNVGAVFSHTYNYDYSIAKENVRINLVDNRTNKTKYNVDHRGFNYYYDFGYIEEYDIYFIKASKDDLSCINYVDYVSHFGLIEKIGDQYYFIYKLRKPTVDANTLTVSHNFSESINTSLQWYKLTTSDNNITNDSAMVTIFDDTNPIRTGATLETSLVYNATENSWTPSHFEWTPFTFYAFFKINATSPYELICSVKGSDISSFSEIVLSNIIPVIYDEAGNVIDNNSQPDNSKTYTAHYSNIGTEIYSTTSSPKLYDIKIRLFESTKLTNETNTTLSTPEVDNSYYVEATYGLNDKTYKSKSNTVLFSKVYETVVIDDDVQTKTYNGNSQAFIISGTNASLGNFTVYYKVGNDWVTTAPTSVGTYDVKITRANDDVYAKYENVITGGLVINKLAVNEPTIAQSTFEYDGTPKTVVLSGVESYMTTSDSISETEVGSYTITYTLDSNYEWANGSDGELTFEITKGKAVEPTIAQSTFEYDGTPKTVVLSGVKSYMTTSDSVSETEIGSYTITYTLDSNYEWATGSDGVLTFEITKGKAVEPTMTQSSFIYDGTQKTVVLNGVKSYMTTSDSISETEIGIYTITYTLDSHYEWATGSDGVLTWRINRKEIVTSKEEPGKKPDVIVDSEIGVEKDIIVEVEITVESEVKEKQLTIDYYNIINDNKNIRLKSNETVGIVFDVKLFRVVDNVKTQIQPSDLEGVTSINVKMLIPEAVDIEKVTRILHVHSSTDIDDISFNKDLVDKDRYYSITINKLSEFAFIYETDAAANSNECNIHWFLLALLILFILFVLILWIAFGIRKFKMEGKLQLAPIIGFVLDLVLLIVISIFAKCNICIVLIVLNALALLCATLLFLFWKEEKEDEEKEDDTNEEDNSSKESKDVEIELDIKDSKKE